MTDMQETCFKLKQLKEAVSVQMQMDSFTFHINVQVKDSNPKNCLQVLSFEHLISFILKRLRHFSLRDMFFRSNWWNRLGHFSLRSRINCWVSSPFRGSCGWGSIPIYHLLGSHTMQPVNQIASDVTRKHGKKQHDKSDDLSTVYPNLSRVVEVHFFK